MKKFLSTAKSGFIDPLSLITLGILIVGLVVTTAIVKNPNISLDIRQWARMIEGTDYTSIRSAQPAKTTQAPAQTTPVQPVNQTEEAPSQPKTPAAPAETRLEKKLCLAEEGIWKNNRCQYPETTAPAAQPTVTQPTEESRFVARQQAEAQYFETHPTPKPTPTPTPKPTPTPVTITKSDYQKCLDKGNTPSECSPIAQNIGQTITTPVDKTECDPNKDKPFCSGNVLKVCSNSGTWGLTTCSSGCANNQCEPKVDSNAGLIATYNILNAVTFGTFGNYIQTYQDINTQNPQASYFQQAFNPQGIAASAQLGVVLTAEAAAAAAAGPAAQAIAGLPVAYLMAQNAIAATPWLQTAAAVATLSQLPASIIACQTQGADSPACQYAAMGITSGYYSDVIGSEQVLQTSAQTINTNIIRPTVNKTLDSIFEAVWEPKLNNAYTYNFTENLSDIQYQRLLEEGKTVIPGTDIPLSSVTFDEQGFFQFDVPSTYNPYQQLLEQTQAGVNAGKTPEEAVAMLMKQKLGLDTEKGNLLESLNFNLQAQESLAGKVWCGTANCVQQSMVAQQLLSDLGVTDTQTIYGLGGAFPFIHSATLTPEGVIMFGGRMTSPEAFTRFTNMIQVMGSFQIP